MARKTEAEAPAAEPEAPRTVRVQMERVLRFYGEGSAPRDVFGEQTLPAAQALAFVLLEFAKPLDPAWAPDPRDCHAAAAEAMKWLETERRKFVSDAAFEAIPATARKLRAIAQLVSDVNLGGDAA